MDEELKKLRYSKVESDRRKAIERLTRFLESHPGDVEAWYAKAGCHDFIGEEKEAEPCYSRVYDLGWRMLPEEDQRSFFVGYGSTLRNNLRFERSAELLNEGIRQFPDSPAIKVFLAFTLYSMANDRAAAKTLFQALKECERHGLEGYGGAVDWYVDHLDSHPEVRKS